MRGTNRKYTRRVQFYEPEVNEKDYKAILGYIPMSDIVLDRANLLRKYQQEILVFTDCKGVIIGYGDVELTEVNIYGDKNEAPLKIENKNDLDYQ